MKSFTILSMIAAAALAVAAGSASAQTLTAEIPMAFSAGGRLMTPGNYDFNVETNSVGHPVLTVRNRATSRQALLFPFHGSDAPTAWRDEGSPKITLECLDGNCTLRTVWNGKDDYQYQLPAHRLRPEQKERLAVVTIGLTRTD